jgi:hypothetical protein
MKNAINYYYDLVTYDIRHKGKQYRFTVDNFEYLLVLCDYDPKELENWKPRKAGRPIKRKK